jgi:DNA primase
MPFPERFLEELMERSDIYDVVSGYVRLTKRGSNYFGLCPFHNEKTPSFSVNQDKQIYKCFGCGKGGSVVNFIMEVENLSYPDAIHFLANKAGMTVPEDDGDNRLPNLRKRLLSLNKDAARFYYSLLGENEGAVARTYLEKRKISPKTATRFGVGCVPNEWDRLTRAMKKLGYTDYELVEAGLAVKNNKGSVYDKFRDRLMFPVIDVRGEVLGFSGRTLSDAEPKYLNSPETPVFSKRRTLFGINLAKNTKRSSIILCEGNIDVVMLHQAGFDNAVASMGTSLTVEQTRLLSRYTSEIDICYDNDPAGIKATDRAIEILKNSEFKVKVIRLPDKIEDGKKIKIDADDYIKQFGADAFEKLISGSDDRVEYALVNLQGKFDISSDEGRVEYLKAAGELIATLGSPVEREVYGGRVAAAVGISAEAMKLEIDRMRKRKIGQQRKKIEKEALSPVAALQPKARALRYDNVRSAAAEEGVIRLLIRDPEIIEACDIDTDEFSSPILGKIYSIIRAKLNEGKAPQISLFSEYLTEDEMSLLVRIDEKPESVSGSREALKDYISVIRTEKLKDSTDLLALAEKYKKTKGMEDKNVE